MTTTKGQQCHFPFHYRGRWQYKCITYGRRVPWCATREQQNQAFTTKISHRDVLPPTQDTESSKP
ncbi:putative Fibronectin type II domain-containing protein 2, partial [Homarus americanus]